MPAQQRRRFDARKSAIGSSYNASRKEVEGSINALFDKHEEQA